MFLSFWGLLYPKIRYPLHTSRCCGHPLPHLASLEIPAVASRMRRRTLRRKGWVSQAEMADVQMKIALSENGVSQIQESAIMVRIDEKEMVAWPTKEDRIWSSPQMGAINVYIIAEINMGQTNWRPHKNKNPKAQQGEGAAWIKICCQIRLRFDFRTHCLYLDGCAHPVSI